ncbi:dihydrofolate reductase family protein [Microbacterium sp. MYb64]|uniref:dihydrofolate reductase family protein n=1 Tax=Microbacterium sp. MYb64 TaxID=1848691 RepID=UPI000CFC4BC9|nr:dihydrofolate reductase family protein [Microbacterium sp. MYb64]PRB07242.1 dihydrofolate reductase [Microbacterium sp. MYb64]
MSTVTVHAVASIDGYIARPDDSVGPLFDWYENGDVAVRVPSSGYEWHVSASSAAYLGRLIDETSCVIMGRHMFDFTNGWNGVPVIGDHVVVVTHREADEWRDRHPDAPFTFCGDIESAIATAKDIAGDGDVVLCAGEMAGQAVAAGLVDRVAIDIVPVVFGQGKRYFGSVSDEILLADPVEVIRGDRVLHLLYPAPARV